MKFIAATFVAVLTAAVVSFQAGADAYTVPGKHEAVVYTGTSFQGQSMLIPQGRAIKLKGRMNNSIASVVVPHGCILTLHDAREGRTRFVRLEGAVPSLRRVLDNEDKPFVNQASRAHLRCYN